MTEREEVQKLEQALALIREVHAARRDPFVQRALTKAGAPLEARIRFLRVFPQNREEAST